ncbi:MAG: serine/threonine protein kinase [Deltaproteobacteria bacterium]|nr:serine/threonine protein kinase [Deltaproteobacteria bacterium]
MSASAEGGIRFGQYILVRRIARGGMAEVFLAQQKGLEGFDRRVAVKRILPHLAESPDFLKMFLSEARLAAQLTHPNVVHIYDFGKHDGDYFIAMEFVDGVHAGQLYKHIEKEPLPATMIARIGADAATALHYAHELRNANGQPLGLVHRDVSPANIMVSFDGVVKLCDFGIAKAVALGNELTNPGQVKGKYAYMSPEQTIAAPLDGRSDVFSLAIVMWELLTGKTIVGRGDPIEGMRAIRDGKLPSISVAAPHTPPALAKALTWALQTSREMRPTAMDFAQALEAFIKSSPELATPMQIGSWVRQRFARVGTGQHDAIPVVSMGTRVQGGTLAGPASAAEDVLDIAANDPTKMERGGRPNLAPTDETATVIPTRVAPRRVLAIGGLVAVAILGVLIARAVREPDHVAPRDAGALIVVAPDPPRRVVIDAPDAPDEPDEPDELTVLEVRTKPKGGTVRVGGESRAAPAQFALRPGKYTIVAELDGYRSETRAVELLKATDLVQEIAFSRKVSPPRPVAAIGKLTVRTTPYSVVFHNGKRLGETPFAELELPVGTYSLVFRNPAHRDMIRQVTITAGTTTKLSFALQ